MTRIWWLIFFFIALLSITLAGLHLIERYVPVGSQMLLNNSFEAGLDTWLISDPPSSTIEVSDNELSLTNSEFSNRVQVWQNFIGNYNKKRLLLEAEVATSQAQQGAKPWNKARIIFVQHQNEEELWRIPHTLIALKGNNDWQSVEKEFIIREGTTSFSVKIQLNEATGSLSVRHLALYEVQQSVQHVWFRWLCRAGWLVYIIILMTGAIRISKLNLKLRFAAWITILTILVGVTMPSQLKNDLKKDITTLHADSAEHSQEVSVNQSPTHNVPAPQSALPKSITDIEITKVAHFSLFALLTFLLLPGNSHLPVLLLIAHLLLLASATESIQFLVDNRSPLTTDIGIDMAGCLLIILIYVIVNYFRQLRLDR